MKVLLIIKKFIYAVNIIALVVALYMEEVLDKFSSTILAIYAITTFIAIVLFMTTGLSEGTPNNHLQARTLLQFEDRTIKRNQFIIDVKEIEKSVWQVHDRFKTKLDMKGWIRQKNILKS